MSYGITSPFAYQTTSSTHLSRMASGMDGFVCSIWYDGPYTNEFSVVEAQAFIASLNAKHEARDYQEDAFIKGVRNKRQLIISPTGSGKSFIAYLFIQYFLKSNMGKGLVIVPRTDLVEQIFGDFEDYSINNGWDVNDYCHRLYSGHDKNTDKKVMISTWQSLQNLGDDFFAQFDYVICDEVHQATAKELTRILEQCVNAKYRLGLTGTLSGSKTHEMVLKGLFGSIHKSVTSSELMERNQLADLTVKAIMLKHPPEACDYFKNAKYQTEMKYLVNCKMRNNFIVNLALSLKGNTLILFNFVEEHGRVIYDLINKKIGPDRKVFFVHGGTDALDRQEIKRIVETEQDAIIVGSSGVFSTGSNVVSLANLILAHPFKSKIRNLQSIGRALRVSDTKSTATVFDITDDLRVGKRANHTLRHFLERVKIYNEEKFRVKLYKVELKGGNNGTAAAA
jgi:superfamily II DNA or RNA helicase